MKGQQISLFESKADPIEIPNELYEGLQAQIKLEFESAYVYFGMATYFRQQDLDGFASWFDAQAKEEMEHGQKIYHYLLDRGVEISLPSLGESRTSYANALEAFEEGLSHEKFISQRIRSLFLLAREHGDVQTEVFLQWFVQEQVEEEALFSKAIQQVRMVDGSPSKTPLLWLDQQFGERVK